MIYTWQTPSGEYSRLYDSLRQSVHLLIAGATGSGKSTVVNGMIHAALYQSPARVGFIIIDPKGCELDEYRRLPHTLSYAHTEKEIVSSMQSALNLVHIRLQDMKRHHVRMYDGSDVYMIIDELMVIMTRASLKKVVFPILQEILTIARAARVHVWACTQSPISRVIPTELKCNFDTRLALRTASAQDSRNIIGCAGCQNFPKPSTEHRAYGALLDGADMTVYSLPLIADAERQRLIDYWQTAKPRRHFFRH